MTNKYPYADLLESLREEDYPLWLVELQLEDRETAKWVVYKFLQHGLAELHEQSTAVPEWKWQTVLENPSSWMRETDRFPTLIYAGNDEKEEEFFKSN